MFLQLSNDYLENAISKKSNKRHAKYLQKNVKLMDMKDLNN